MAKKRAVLVEKRILTHDVYELVFQFEEKEAAAFKAGQFVSIEVPARHADEKMVMRQYSISSIPDDTNFELCIKQIPGGRATDGYFPTLTKGDVVSFVGPAGRFTQQPAMRPIVFIATGTGVAPFKSMLEEMWAKGDKTPVTLLFGVRHEKDVLYQEYFEEKMNSEHFLFIPCISRPEGNWEGYTGRVTQYLESTFDYTELCDFYICGNGSVIEEVKNLLLAKNVLKEHIFFEKYNNL